MLDLKNKYGKVAVLYGGESAEREVSLSKTIPVLIFPEAPPPLLEEPLWGIKKVS